VTIDGVDAFGFGSVVVVWIDKFARAVLVTGGLGILNNTLVRFPILGLGLLLA